MAQIMMNKEHTVRGKKYKAMVSFTKDGRRKRFSKTFDTKKEATQWASSLESEKANGTSYDMSDTLFHQWFWLWFKTYREDHISSSTRVSYRNTREKLKQLLPNVKVNKLTRPLIQAFFDKLDLSKGTKRKMLNHVRASLKDAVLDGVINKNPATRIQINADKSLTKKEVDKFLSDSDFTRVRDSLFNKDYKFQDSKDMALLVVACTGCRIGEVLDLQFGDVNYDTSEIKIDSSWDRLTHSSKEPKTENSNRIIKISSTLLQKLKRWESVVKQELIRRGKQNDVTHLFLNPN